MAFFNERNEMSDITESNRENDNFFNQELFDKYDKILGDDKLESERNEISNISETDRKEEFLSDQELFDRYDKILGDDKLESEGNDISDIHETGDSKKILPEHTHTGLTEEESIKVKEEQNWSEKVIVFIGSWEEYEIYKGAELEEREIGDKLCLIRSDIDWDKKWETGKYDEEGNPIYETNEERIQKGRAPLDDNGNPIQLHHIGQHADSPLAELTFEEHRCNGNDTILHDKTIETEAHAEGNNWDMERQDYWRNRADYNEGGMAYV